MSKTIDHNKGICKQYKETGYCSYGDSCVFLHERYFEDTPTPHQENTDTCIYCKKQYFEKIVTLCNHNFCLNCAIKQFKDNERCFICKKFTYGQFKPLF
ncbi:hypothetical protein CWI37_1753p0010 [Hamiltosporidium tvaerminnensis]|uniref:Pre-mRNA-splicing factor CWC24 n=2 Tax=Hamiltosporidium TaxID=1176354 RepID=A0A4Q9L7Q5_9MICR|nr:hypothetical protein CWI37_1753p0010 [Hamiltosporidium tvaerminnensis]TBU03594.1 hypothetical protein CWI39_0942p0010 [Hamiltosporidium magnivora]